MLDYGYRSRCCKSTIRLGKKKKNNVVRQVWVCTKCRRSDVDIISNDELNSQGVYKRSDMFSYDDLNVDDEKEYD